MYVVEEVLEIEEMHLIGLVLSLELLTRARRKGSHVIRTSARFGMALQLPK